MMLRIEITTPDNEEDEAFVHEVPLDTDKFEIIQAINTLYGNDVICIRIAVIDAA